MARWLMMVQLANTAAPSVLLAILKSTAAHVQVIITILETYLYCIQRYEPKRVTS